MAVAFQTDEDLFDTVARTVFNQVRRIAPQGLRPDASLDMPLGEIGLDSLATMEVINALEETFGLRFTEDSLYDIETCRDLVKYIEATLTARTPSRAPGASAPTPASPELPATTEPLPRDFDVTQFPECVALQDRLTGSEAAGFENPFFRVKQGAGKARATIDGRDVVSYTSFDYLGMSGHPEVVSAAKQAIDRFGASASASRLVGGNNSLHQELDDAIAQFLGTEAAATFPSGYGTNASVLGHLFGENDLILHDELAHNSIVQGTRLSGAQRRPFPHNDFEHLDKLLRDVRGNYRRVVVAIEGVYSMDGDYPDLPKVLEIKQRHRALLYVDEAHSLGVMGTTGRGICEHFGVDPGDGDLWMGTISKALGSLGGYLAGRRILVQYLKYTTPSFVFATALSPGNAAAALAAVQLLRRDSERVARLRDRSRLFQKLAMDSGLDTGNSKDTPIVPILLRNSGRCLRATAALLRQGIDVQPILYPAVPEAASRLRFFITAEHTEEQICRTIELLTQCLASI